MYDFRRIAFFVVFLFAFVELNCGGGPPPALNANSTQSAGGNGSSGSSNGGSSNSGSSGTSSGTGSGSGSGGGSGSSGGNSGGSGNSGTTMSELHQKGGWNGYGELPSSYAICTSCSPSGPAVTWSMQQGISSPSQTGNATNFTIGGQEPYSDVIWINHLIGDSSSQGLPDSDHSIDSSSHNFTYDVYFYGTNLSAAQALEFDINQYVDGKSFIWGHQCRIANGANWWDISVNNGQNWQPTNIPCNTKENAWNHVTIQVQRTSDDQLLFQTITLNGQTSTLNYQEQPGSTSWHGITINYQQDGDFWQQQYTVTLDNLNFTYW